MNTTNETHLETAHHKAILDAIAENQKQLEDIAEKQKQMQDVTLAMQEIQRLLRKQDRPLARTHPIHVTAKGLICSGILPTEKAMHRRHRLSYFSGQEQVGFITCPAFCYLRHMT